MKLNYDEEPSVGQRYGVIGLPTMVLFRDGEPVRSFVGAKPKARLIAGGRSGPSRQLGLPFTRERAGGALD